MDNFGKVPSVIFPIVIGIAIFLSLLYGIILFLVQRPTVKCSCPQDAILTHAPKHNPNRI